MTMPNKNEYYLKEVYFTSARPEWHENYLTTREDRLTSLLQSSLGNNFWENYGRVRLDFEKQGLLLLRIKSITESSVCISQIWTSLNVAEKFRVDALRGVDMMALLKERGINNKEVEKFVTKDEITRLISEIRTRPHIIQVIVDPWKTSDMVIGDPLKRGKLYLPFPN